MGNHDEDLDKTAVSGGETMLKKVGSEESPPSIVILIGPDGYAGKQFYLDTQETIVGRAANCTVAIDDGSLSRNHCRFNIMNNDVSVIDLGSTNKTMVNGEALKALTPHVLKNNDQIKAGNVVLKFLERGNIEGAAAAQLLERASKDSLTGAYSKGDLLIRGPELIKRAETLGEPLSVIIFDIDFFKKINDTYGHPGGDYVLKELGHLIGTRVVRANDYFARFGGEEFVLFLTGGTKQRAHEVAERVRVTVQAHPFVYEGRPIPVTISLGVAERLPSERDWNQLFERADTALYSSKHNGRNKVTVAP